ncbi:hypothetical protein AX17_006734 [Amanita inopinata Kibby_2008]|nr:hypothetical protein AX17_006734 [Amanita inopinata Kibby_2008]
MSEIRASAEETMPDKTDVIQPIHDELKLNVVWWLLEIIPLSRYWQDADGVWHKKISVNLGKGRTIYDRCPKLHISVKERMEDPSLNYVPKAKWEKGTEVYVE